MLLMSEDKDKELIAAEFHEIWSEWMGFIFRQCIKNPDGSVYIPKEFVDHWVKRMGTKYEDLPEEAKGWQRENAAKFIKILEE